MSVYSGEGNWVVALFWLALGIMHALTAVELGKLSLVYVDVLFLCDNIRMCLLMSFSLTPD